jgi:hypothetical protein
MALASAWAVEVAAAGGHHLLLTGPPGTGKTMLAQRMIGLSSKHPCRVERSLGDTGVCRDGIGSLESHDRVPQWFSYLSLSAIAFPIASGWGPPNAGPFFAA